MPVLSQWHSMGISGAPVLETIGIVCEDPTHGLGTLEALYGKQQKGQSGPPMALSARTKHAALGPHRCCIENQNKAGLGLQVPLYRNLRRDGLCLPWHYSLSLVLQV